MPDGFLRPDWPAPACVHAWVATRKAPGVSGPPYDRCNLGDHVGDDPIAVRRNRECVQSALALPSAPLWLSQVHGVDVLDASRHAGPPGVAPVADAAYTRHPGQVLVVMTADCLPLLICADDGSEVAAVHAGWRGLAAGVIEATVEKMRTPPGRLIAWLGPAIGPQAFEVGADVRAAFLPSAGGAAAFVPIPARDGVDKWHCDLYQLARLRLAAQGISRTSGGDACTVTDAANYFSHRRDRMTGRIATLIWMSPPGVGAPHRQP